MGTERKGTGAKDRRVTFVNYAPGQDEFGGPTSTETGRFTVWAAVTDKSGNQVVNAAQIGYEYDVRVQVRFNGRITSDSVMIYEEQRYSLNSVAVESEGYHKDIIIRASKIEQPLNIS